MGIEAIREHFKKYEMDKQIMEFTQSSATVDQAAATIGVVHAQIAKTISLRNETNWPCYWRRVSYVMLLKIYVTIISK